MDERFIRDGLQHSLPHLVEECGEVVKAAGKIMRFGLFAVNPLLPEEEQKENAKDLVDELQDLKSVIERVEKDIRETTRYEKDKS